jgi:DNA-binding transcriptional regulator YiaG
MLEHLLYTMRLNVGLSVLNVSHALHVSTVVVYCWERGDTRPRPAHLAALMRLYCATPHELDEVAHLAAFGVGRGEL